MEPKYNHLGRANVNQGKTQVWFIKENKHENWKCLKAQTQQVSDKDTYTKIRREKKPKKKTKGALVAVTASQLSCEQKRTTNSWCSQRIPIPSCYRTTLALWRFTCPRDLVAFCGVSHFTSNWESGCIQFCVFLWNLTSFHQCRSFILFWYVVFFLWVFLHSLPS